MATFSSDIKTYTNNYNDYSKISFEEITYELGSIIKLKSNNIQDFYRSSLGTRLAEAFASTLNVNWKYLESSFRDCFLQSAQNYSSIISNANSQGYSIRRPTSSKANFRVEIDGSVGSYSGKLTIPKFSNITYNGTNFITLDDYEFSWDYNGNVSDTTAIIVQGEFRTRRFLANGKKKFASFNFSDDTFSNYYGEDDLFNENTPLDERITTVCVDGDYYDISKYSLYSSDKSTSPYVSNGVLVESSNKKCKIRTANNGNIELLFGDGIISEIPKGLIEIKYLSSLGSSGNISNAIDTELSFGGPQKITYQPASITDDNVTILLNNSPLGGDDIESIDSVKQNASKSYAAQERYVTDDDYKTGLLTDASNVKYAIAYGEDSLSIGDYRYFNVVQYSVLKNIYLSDSTNSELRIAEPYEYIFSGINTIDNIRKMQDNNGYPMVADSYDLSIASNELDDQEKYNEYLLTYGEIFRLSKQDIESGSELDSINTLLRKKGQLTCRHVYVPPKVHKYKMSMVIYTNPIVSKNDLKTSVKNDAYQYLKENTHFNFPIYNSKIVKLIEAKSGIVGCHVYFDPSDYIPNDSSYVNKLVITSSNIFNDELAYTMENIQTNYYTSVSNSKLYQLDDGEYESLLSSYFAVSGSDIMDINKLTEKNISAFIDRIYKETLGRLVLNPLLATSIPTITSILTSSILNNPETSENIYDIFVRWAVQFRQDTNYYSAKRLITDRGDIANFSIPHEIAQVSIDTSDITITTKTT